MTTPDVHAQRTAGDVVRGLLALGVVLLLLGGVPAALVRVAGDPLPHRVPDLESVQTALTTPDDGSLFVSVLVLAAWLGWATFAVALVVEVPAQLRGCRTPRLPALALQQGAASRLVALMTVFVPTSALLAVPSAYAIATASAPATPTLTGSTARLDATARTDVGGQLGQQASMPVTTPTVHGDKTPEVVTVQRGDTLSAISERYLGEADRYPEIVEATREVVQPDGRHLTDPDVIYPGWRVDLPAPVNATSPPPNGVPTPQAAPPTTSGAGEFPAPPAPPPPPATTPTAPATATAPLTPPEAAQHGSNPGDADRSITWIDGETQAWTAGGLGALTAAGLVALLARKRLRQQRTRRTGQRPPVPPPAAVTTERRLQAIQDPLTVDKLDRILRTLSARCFERKVPLPRLQVVRLLPDQVELHLTEPAVPVLPFRATGTPDCLWSLDPDADLIDDLAADDVPPPYPALVSLGRDLDDAQVLLDLEQAGVLVLAGTEEPPPEAEADTVVSARALLGALLVELSTSAWGGDLRVTSFGGDPVITAALAVDRVDHVDDLDDVLKDLRTWAGDLRAAMSAADVDDPGAARRNRTTPDAWASRVLLIETPVAPAQVSELRDLLTGEPSLPLAVVTTLAVWPSAWTVTPMAGTNLATLHPAGLTLHPQVLPSDVADLLVQALSSADAEPVSPQPTATSSVHEEESLTPEVLQAPPEVVDEEQAGPSSAEVTPPPAGAPEVLVLGPVDVVGTRGDLSGESHRSRITEAVAFLALHPHRQHHLLDEALWPGERVPDARRHQLISRARRWLGTDEDGHPFVPVVGPEGYRLASSVGTDWGQFTALVPGPVDRASTEDLVSALALVRGQPFAGTNPRRYGWADVDRQEMIAMIADVAHELGDRARALGDAALARRAATTGLAVEPGSEALWRDALLAEQLAGHRANIELLADRLLALADDLGGDLEPETLAVLGEVLRRPSDAAR